MNQRIKTKESETRMFDVNALCEYISMGKTRATEFGEKCGAKRKIGKRTLYDKRIIDRALDELDEQNMGKQKRQYVPKRYESKKQKGDVSANIYASMVQSPAWWKLTPRARDLYVHMKLQLYGQKTIPDREPEYFYFNKAMWKEVYPLYTNQGQFYKDRDSLVENGFIEIVERGQNTRTKAIYKFSDRWQEVN